MTGYDFYKLYNAIRLHFSSESYNFFTFDGQIKSSVDAFEKRKDKYVFHKLARMYKEEVAVSFLVANFVAGNASFSRKLVSAEAAKAYTEWMRVTESMSETFKNDLARIVPVPTEFNKLFEVNDGQLPRLLVCLQQKDITIETMVILNNILDFIRIWDKKIEDDVIYPKYSMKIRKYGSFLTVDTSKYKNLLKTHLTST
jgi:hypothetical protein